MNKSNLKAFADAVITAASITLAILLGCASPSPRSAPSTPAPIMSGVTDPLARIGPRQEFIKDMVPELPLVVKQADATIADALEARTGVDAARTGMQADLDRLVADNAAIAEELESERDASNKWFHRCVNVIRLLCLVGISGGVVMAVILKRTELALVSLAAVVTLAAIAIEGFMHDYAVPIAGVALAALVTMGLVCLYTRHRAVEELVQSGRAMLAAGRLTAPDGKPSLKIADHLDKIQSKTTKKFVNRVAGAATVEEGS